jgi:hypothetical protein
MAVVEIAATGWLIGPGIVLVTEPGVRSPMFS